MIGLAAQVQPLDVEALHKLDEGDQLLPRQQPLQLLGTDDDDGILAANSDALGPLVLRSPHHLAARIF